MVVASIARLPLPLFLSLLLVAVLSEISIIDYSMALSQRSSLIVRRGFCGRGFLSSCITSNHVLSIGEKRRWPSSNLIPRSSLQQRSYSASSSLFANNIDAPSSSSQKRYTSSNTSSSHKPQSGEEESENWSNYERLVRKLYMTNLFNPVKLGLENMDRLHKILGSPMDQVSSYPFIEFSVRRYYVLNLTNSPLSITCNISFCAYGMCLI